MSFDSATPGTSAKSWTARLAGLPRFDLEGFTHLVVVAAHPDDETLGAGGLIGQCAKRGMPVHVVVATDGGKSHPNSPTHGSVELAALRSLEVRAALDLLAPEAHLTLLGYPDGETREYAENIRADVAAIVDATPATTIVASPWRGDGHRDHRIVGEATAAAVGSRTLLEYPVWMWHWAEPDDQSLPWDDFTTLETGPGKQAAIRAHRSQVEPLSPAAGDEPMLDPAFLEHFDGTEEVFVAHRFTAAMPPEYFEALYAKREDPWRLATRWYEQRKRSITIAALPERRYSRTLEIGCSVGMLTTELAARSDSVLAIDVSSAAVASARRRTGETVTVRQADITDGVPDGEFDLVVLSEVGYYLSAEALESVMKDIDSHLTSDGTLVICHWRHEVDDYRQSGDAVHAVIAATIADHDLPLHKIVGHLEKDFSLDVYTRDPRSVAEREGIR